MWTGCLPCGKWLLNRIGEGTQTKYMEWKPITQPFWTLLSRGLAHTSSFGLLRPWSRQEDWDDNPDYMKVEKNYKDPSLVSNIPKYDTTP